MPLRSGYSFATYQANVAEMIAYGHERTAAIMASASHARKCFFKRFPRGALPIWLAYPKHARTIRYYDAGGHPLRSLSNGIANVLVNPIPRGNAQINRILESDATPRVKILRLQNLALRTMASSPRQKEIIAAYEKLESQYGRVGAPPDVREATALYRGFTGQSPRTLRRLDIPPLPKSGLAIGKVFGIMYSVDATNERFHHEFKGKARPTLIVASDGKSVYLRGGAYTFTKRGFVDHK